MKNDLRQAMANQEHTSTSSFDVGLENIRDLFNETSEVSHNTTDDPNSQQTATSEAVAAANNAVASSLPQDPESEPEPDFPPWIPTTFPEYLCYRVYTYGYNSFTFGFPNDRPAFGILPPEAYSCIEEYAEYGKCESECIDFGHLESMLLSQHEAVHMGLCDKLFFDYLDWYHPGLMDFMAKADDDLPQIEPLFDKWWSDYDVVRVRVERAVLQLVVAEKTAALEKAAKAEIKRINNVDKAMKAGQMLYWPILGPSMEEAKRSLEWRTWELVTERFRLEKIEEVPLCEHYGI